MRRTMMTRFAAIALALAAVLLSGATAQAQHYRAPSYGGYYHGYATPYYGHGYVTPYYGGHTYTTHSYYGSPWGGYHSAATVYHPYYSTYTYPIHYGINAYYTPAFAPNYYLYPPSGYGSYGGYHWYR